MVSSLNLYKRPVNGNSFLPEQAAAAADYNAAMDVSSPPQPGIGMAAAAAPASNTAGAGQQTDLPVLAGQSPASATSAPAAPAPQAQKPLIDFKQNPLGAIGLVLGNVAAGMRGATLPSDILKKQQLEEQAQSYQSAALALEILDKTSTFVARLPPAQQSAAIKDLSARFAPALHGQSIEPFLTAAATGGAARAASMTAALKELNPSPQMLSYWAANPTAGIKALEDYTAHKANQETPTEAAAKAGEIEAAQLAAKSAAQPTPPEGYSWQPDKTLKIIPHGPADPETIRAQTAARKTDEENFSTPITVEADAAGGGRDQFIAQQNKKTGQWVMGDQSRTPLNNVVLPGGIPGGGRAAAQISRLVTAARDIKSDLQNAAELPAGASSGFWAQLMGGTSGQSLYGATRNVLGNTLSSQEVQDYNATFVGLGKALGTLDAGGLQTSDAFIRQLEGLQLKEGDTGFTKLRKFSLIRQQAENALETQIVGPLLNKDQKKDARALKEALAVAIPWTPNDVTKLEQVKNPHATIRDLAKSQGLGTASVGAPAAGAGWSVQRVQ